MSKFRPFLLGAALVLSVPILMSATNKQKVSNLNNGNVYIELVHEVSCNGCADLLVLVKPGSDEMRTHLAHGDKVVGVVQQ